MIASRRKLEDMRTRAAMLDVLEIQVRNGLTEDAKEVGKASQKLAEKIRTHDYTNDKTFEEIWQEKVEAGAKANGIELPKDCWKDSWG
jgi:hypothetical protein